PRLSPRFPYTTLFRSFEFAREVDLDHFGHREPVRLARHRVRDLEAARTDREHAAGSRMRRVGVAAEHRLPWDVEALHVGPMADRSEEHTSELQSPDHL